MALFVKGAESKFLERLEAISGEAVRWRAGVLKCSQMDLSYKRLLREPAAQGRINAMTMESEANAYFCRDFDIVFLFSDMKSNFMTKLKALIEEVLPGIDPESPGFDNLFSLYDLGIALDEVKDFVKSKLRYGDKKEDAEYVGHDGAPSNPAQIDDKLFAEASIKRGKREKPLIAIIEDEEMVRQLAKTVLQPPYHVITARDGLEALDIYVKNAPDLVFLDINMPEMDGISVLKKIMEIDPAAKVVMFSVKSTHETILEAKKLGAKGFVTKPFKGEKLLQYAQKMLAE